MKFGKRKVGKNKQSRRNSSLDIAVRRARRVARWHNELAPLLPEMDPLDLHLILDCYFQSRKERMQYMFLKQRQDGRYVF